MVSLWQAAASAQAARTDRIGPGTGEVTQQLPPEAVGRQPERKSDVTSTLILGVAPSGDHHLRLVTGLLLILAPGMFMKFLHKANLLQKQRKETLMELYQR